MDSKLNIHIYIYIHITYIREEDKFSRIDTFGVSEASVEREGEVEFS